MYNIGASYILFRTLNAGQAGSESDSVLIIKTKMLRKSVNEQRKIHCARY